MAAKSAAGKDKTIAVHRKARFQFEVLDTVEAGIVLHGTEVKSLRDGQASLEEAFARIYGDELFVIGMHIPEYRCGNVHNHEPTRKRKLLLRRRELRRLKSQVQERGLSLVPLRLYWNEKGLAKIELGLCKGRKTHDKRQKLKEQEDQRELRGDQRPG